MTGKHLALALFVSLGVNLFLGGLLVGSMDDRDEHHHPGHHPPESIRPGDRLGPPNVRARPGPPTPGREGRPGDRGPRRRGDGGPDDLVLLRSMVRVMGGPSDPRVRKVRESSRDDIREMRQSMRAAREKVETAFAKEPFDDAALAAAMEEVRQRGTEAQKRAQDSVLELAAVMTDEERKKLRQLAHDDRDRRREKAGGRKGWKGPDDRRETRPKSPNEKE